jgi:hypothetical protein
MSTVVRSNIWIRHAISEEYEKIRFLSTLLPPKRKRAAILLFQEHIDSRLVTKMGGNAARKGPDADALAYVGFLAIQRCSQPPVGKKSSGTRTSTTETLSRPPF